MKIFATAVLTIAGAVSTLATPALAQDSAAKPGPVEAFYCNYQPGKNKQDLLKVANRFSKWADKNYPSHSAWILTPRYAQLSEVPQMLWLGSAPSGNELGKGLDAWLKSGNDIQAAFDEVVQCGMHALASSVEVNAPDGPPGDGVVMFSQCSFAEGVDMSSAWSNAVSAHKKYAAAMRSMGARGSNWMFFPMIGGPGDLDLDYWGVTTFKNWTDYFAAYEIYVNGGGWQEGMKAMQGVAQCETGSASVWDVELVRQGAE